MPKEEEKPTDRRSLNPCTSDQERAVEVLGILPKVWDTITRTEERHSSFELQMKNEIHRLDKDVGAIKGDVGEVKGSLTEYRIEQKDHHAKAAQSMGDLTQEVKTLSASSKKTNDYIEDQKNTKSKIMKWCTIGFGMVLLAGAFGISIADIIKIVISKAF